MADPAHETRIAHLEQLTSDHEMRLRWLERIIGYGLGAIGAAKLIYDMFSTGG